MSTRVQFVANRRRHAIQGKRLLHFLSAEDGSWSGCHWIEHKFLLSLLLIGTPVQVTYSMSVVTLWAA
jgi:hypothetical protein